MVGGAGGVAPAGGWRAQDGQMERLESVLRAHQEATAQSSQVKRDDAERHAQGGPVKTVDSVEAANDPYVAVQQAMANPHWLGQVVNQRL